MTGRAKYHDDYLKMGWTLLPDDRLAVNRYAKKSGTGYDILHAPSKKPGPRGWLYKAFFVPMEATHGFATEDDLFAFLVAQLLTQKETE